MVNCRTLRIAIRLASVLLVIPGCGGSDWGYLEGTVLVNGEPVGPGTIALEPIDGDRAGAVASFGQDGRYAVRSAGRKEGAPTGEYRVLVYGGESFGEEQPGPRPKSEIPARYANPSTSDLTVTIERDSKTVDFDLKP